MEILKCNNLSASYEGDAVLGSLSFTVNEGDYLCILGENGSGKSTLVKCLLGIKKADSGNIVLGSGLKHSDIGYLPQHTEMKNGFPCYCQGSCSVRLPCSPWNQTFLFLKRKKGCRRSFGTCGNFRACRQGLPSAFRRSAAADASCPCFVRS